MRVAGAVRTGTGSPDSFPSVSTDTRTLGFGALFVALQGERFDGHDYLVEAARRGASGALVRRGTAASRPDTARALALFEVDDPLAALGALGRFHRDRFRIPVGAVGGSNGKTTTKEMAAAILGTRGEALATQGNLNNEIGVPLTLFRLSRRHVAAVLELGMSTPGELARITAIARPDAGVLTVVTEEHLATLGDLEGVAAAEGELFRNLPPGATAVVNLDDPLVVKQAEGIGRRLSFGTGADADVRLSRATSRGAGGLEIVFEEGGRSGSCRLSFVGEHNATNAAAAFALARALGFSFEECLTGLERARPYLHRSCVVSTASGVTLLDDCYNANPSSMAAALATLGTMKGNGRAFAVLGDMLELGQAEERAHRELGARARGVADVVAFFGPRTRAAFEAFGDGREAAHFLEVEPLLEWLRPRLAPGDTVLVKGSRGMRLERVVDALAGSTRREL